MSFTLHVENLRALRRVEWSPEGVCALVGANGSGKSTLLQVLRFLNLAVTRGVDEAFRQTFGSTHGLRNRLAHEREEIRIGVELDGLRWWMTLRYFGPSLALPLGEEFEGGLDGYAWVRRGDTVYDKRSGEQQQMVRDLDTLALQEDVEYDWPEAKLLSMAEGLRVYHDPELWSLRMHGSSTTADSLLHSRATNVFTVLRAWNERREHRRRYQFVLDGLRAAFPAICSDLDFESAGQTTFVRLWAPGSELPTPIAHEANGVLAMLVYLCDIASGEPGGLVAIDEPENSLHPHALRVLVESAEAWFEAYGTTVVLATHSPVILNELTGTPERVWVMRIDAGDTPNPTRLDRLKNPEWLRHFALGTLYASGELGSNDDAA